MTTNPPSSGRLGIGPFEQAQPPKLVSPPRQPTDTVGPRVHQQPFCPENYPIYQPSYPKAIVQTVNQSTQSFPSTTSSLPGTTSLDCSTSGSTQPASGAVNPGANASFTPSQTAQNCVYPNEEEHHPTQTYQQGADYPYTTTTAQGCYPVYSYDGSTPGALYYY